jgi:hypothetical protein
MNFALAMKRLAWTVGVVLALTVCALVAVPYFFKDQIVAFVKNKANEQLTVQLNFNDLDISLLRSFPHASVRLSDVSVVHMQNATFAGDTLFSCERLDVSLDPRAYFSDRTIKLLGVDVTKPLLNLRIAGNGEKNWSVTKPDTAQATTQEPSRTKIALSRYAIIDGTMRFRAENPDNTVKREFLLTGLSHTGRGDFASDVFTLQTESTALMSFINNDVAYLNNVQTKLLMDVAMNLKTMKFSFAQNELTLNALKASFEGFFAMPDSTDDMEFDIRFATTNNEFKSLLSLVPAVYSSRFAELQSSGSASIRGFVKGVYNDTTYPGFEVNILAENGSFRYPKLPVGVSKAFLDMQVASPGGSGFDGIVVDIRRCALLLGQDPFSMTMQVRTPASDPFVRLDAEGRIVLNNIKDLLPPEMLEGKQLSGTLQASVHFKGARSSVANKIFSAIEASGTISAENVSFASAALPPEAQPVGVAKALLSLSPQYIALKECAVKLGSGVEASSMNLVGTLDNLLGYMLDTPADSVLKGKLVLTSPFFDCNPWMRDSSTSRQSRTNDTELAPVDIPANLDMTFAATMNAVRYTNLTFNDVRGTIIIRDKTLRFENLGMKAFGGGIVMNGSYESRTISAPKTQFDLKITSIDMPSAFSAFSSLQAIAPMTAFMKGTFSAGLQLTSELDGKLKPVWNTFNSNGGLTIAPLRFEGFKPLNQAADLLNLDFLRDPTIAKINPYYEIRDGRLYVKPFSVKIGSTDVLISGSNGLDKSIDYTLTVNLPANKIPEGALAAVPALGGALEKIADKARSRPIPLNIKITGTFDNPIITPSVAGASAEDAASQVLDAVQEEAKKRAQEEIDKAKQQLQEEANRKAKELEQKAKEAEQKAREEAERKAKEAIKDKAPSVLKNLFGPRESKEPKDTTKH